MEIMKRGNNNNITNPKSKTIVSTHTHRFNDFIFQISTWGFSEVYSNVSKIPVKTLTVYHIFISESSVSKM